MIARVTATVIGVVAIAFVALLATREPAQSTVAPSTLTGKPAPAVVGESLEGETVRLSDFRGKYVVLNFFASWCVPCQREHDDLLAFSERHTAKGDAQVLAVIFSDERSAAARFFEERGGDWPVLSDPKGQVALDYGVRGPPESFLIAPNGLVLTRIVGEVTDEALEDLIRQAERLADS
ncbi:MAG: TlpA family protein disulfide reductase [Acidimicrobiia bacterium]